jgi:hypothetical protein
MATGNSRFVQLTDFILLEYIYTSLALPEEINTSVAGFNKIENGYFDNNQILNKNNAVDKTGNVLDRSVVQIDGTRFAHLDPERVTQYLDTDPMLTNVIDLPIVFTPNIEVPYDTVKFHFLSGYNFDDLDGVILQITAKERSGKNLVMAQLAVLKTDDYFKLNPKPIFLGDRLYDKWIEIKIPTLKLVIDDFIALEGSPSQADTFVAKVTTDGRELLRNNPFTVTAININSSEEIERQLYLLTGHSKSVSLKQTDEFALFTAALVESSTGDYYEYYGSFDGGFPDDFISNLNSMGNDYILIHELEVFEQIGNNFSPTFNSTSVQNNHYDAPNLFRPIILNAESAISFSIDYRLRLLNKKDNTQIIRTASLSSTDVSKWGRSLTKIKLRNEPDATNVYNKIVKGAEIFMNNTEVQSTQVQTKYIPSFFDKRLISIKKENLFVNTQGEIQSSLTDKDQVIYGQGSARIIIDPFDTFVKFIIFSADNKLKNVVPMDLGTNSKYTLVFIDNDLKKVEIDQYVNVASADQTKGELLFKVSGNIGIKMKDFANREFYITSHDPGGIESKIYQGIINTPDEIKELLEAEEAIASQNKLNLEAKITDLEAKLAAAELKAQQNALTTKPQGADPIRVTLAPSKAQGGSVDVAGSSGIDVPGLATSHVTVSPVQLIRPSQAVIDAKNATAGRGGNNSTGSSSEAAAATATSGRG